MSQVDNAILVQNLSPEQLTELMARVFKKGFEDLKKELNSQIDQPKQLLNIQETAEFLNLTVPTIYSKVSKRELPVMKQGNRLYFSRTELFNYIEDGRKKSNAEIETEVDNFLKKKGGKNE
jgi:excisionase family DNA binding protein